MQLNLHDNSSGTGRSALRRFVTQHEYSSNSIEISNDPLAARFSEQLYGAISFPYFIFNYIRFEYGESRCCRTRTHSHVMENAVTPTNAKQSRKFN